MVSPNVLRTVHPNGRNWPCLVKRFACQPPIQDHVLMHAQYRIEWNLAAPVRWGAGHRGNNASDPGPWTCSGARRNRSGTVNHPRRRSRVPRSAPCRRRPVTLPNRIAVGPTCRYSDGGGLPDDRHLAHHRLACGRWRGFGADRRLPPCRRSAGCATRTRRRGRRSPGAGGGRRLRVAADRAFIRAGVGAVGATGPRGPRVPVAAERQPHPASPLTGSTAAGRSRTASGPPATSPERGRTWSTCPAPAACTRSRAGLGHRVPFAGAVRSKAEVPVGTAVEITEARQAGAVLTDGAVDLVPLGRGLARDPVPAVARGPRTRGAGHSAEAVRQGVVQGRVKGRAAGGSPAAQPRQRVWMRQRR